MDPDRLKIIALSDSASFGEAVAAALGLKLTAHEERSFEDGEHKLRPLEAVAGADVHVICSLHGGPDRSGGDKLCRLLFFIGALKDAGAARVTAVAPYLCYARKDRRTKPFDPVATRYVAALFEAVGTDVLLTLEPHNPAAFDNAFRRRAVALTANTVFLSKLEQLGEGPFVVVSPDPGGVKRAELFREALERTISQPVGKAFVDKRRSGGVVSGELLVGEVAGATALILDDLVSTGGTLVRAARALRKGGARRVLALAAHGLFMQGAAEALTDPAIDRLIVTDAVPPFRLTEPAPLAKVEVRPCAPLIAEAIARLHEDRDLSDLLVY